MKTKEELKQLKDEVEKLGEKLNELNEDELQEVTGCASCTWRSVLIGSTATYGGAVSK